MHHGAEMATPGGMSSRVRRIIFLRVRTDGHASESASLFALAATREPKFYADVDLHALSLLQVKDLGPGTGWGQVPTPMF